MSEMQKWDGWTRYDKKWMRCVEGIERAERPSTGLPGDRFTIWTRHRPDGLMVVAEDDVLLECNYEWQGYPGDPEGWKLA